MSIKTPLITFSSVVMLALFAVSCGTPPPGHIRRQVGALMESAEDVYSSIYKSANANAVAFQPERANLIVGTTFAALTCVRIREILANLDAKEKMQETITDEDYTKLFEEIDAIVKNADNLATNPAVVNESSDVERLRLREAQALVKKASKLAAPLRIRGGA